jgi:FeS assembly SUF system protein
METKTIRFDPPLKPLVRDKPMVAEDATLEEKIIAALRSIYDPELPVNIYDLGLIYELHVSDDGEVDIKMTLTAPGCPVAGSLPGQVEDVVREVTGVSAARVELVWDPPWTRDRISEAAQLELGLL